MDKNVVVLSFAEASKAYQALSELKAAAGQGQVELDTAAVVGFGPDFTPDREEVETGSPLLTSTSPFADLLRGHDGGGR